MFGISRIIQACLRVETDCSNWSVYVSAIAVDVGLKQGKTVIVVKVSCMFLVGV